jgi:hypothetical protein
MGKTSHEKVGDERELERKIIFYFLIVTMKVVYRKLI